MQRTRFTGAICAISAFLLLALVASSPGFADSISSKGRVAAPAAASGPAFKSGPWIGAKVDTTSTDFAGINLSNDVSYGVAGGYDYIFSGSAILVGVMGDISMPHSSVSGVGEIDYSWFVGARIGALVSDRFLAYGLVGYTSLDGSLPSAIDTTGFTYGAGAELMVTQNLSAGLEWRRLDVGTDMGPLVVTQDSVGAFLRYRF